MAFGYDWFGPSVDDLREERDRHNADYVRRLRKLVANHEAAGGIRPTAPPTVAAGDFVSGEDIRDRELWEAYRELDRLAARG